MTQTEDEKELVLGNKQLVSFFFVVLALCGVFFALGYMIGRNSTKTAVIASDAASPGGTAGSVSPLPPNPAAETQRESAPVARQEPQTAAPAPVPEPRAATAAEPAPETRAEVPAVRETITPEPGSMYLQVTAVRRGDAENLVRTLREQNFPALLATSSKPELFRVMVGPYKQTAQVADAKARLKALGFGDAIMKK